VVVGYLLADYEHFGITGEFFVDGAVESLAVADLLCEGSSESAGEGLEHR